MDNFLNEFRNMVTEIYNHPKTIVLNYSEYEPVTDVFIDEIETKINFKIPQNIRKFYRQTNGIKFDWVHMDDECFDEEKHIQENIDISFTKKKNRTPMFCPDGDNVSGSINIMAIQDVFLTECLEFTWLYDKKRNYYKPLYLFDMFSWVFGAAIYFPNTYETANIIFDFDHYAGFDDNHQMRFDDYLRFLLNTKCVKRMRYLQFINDKISKVNLDQWDEEYNMGE